MSGGTSASSLVTATSGPLQGQQVVPSFDTSSGGGNSDNQSSLNTLNMGSALKTMGIISSGVSKYNSYNSQESADNFNASIQNNNAAIVGQESASNEANLRLQQGQKIGQQRANMAEAGIGPISGGSAGEAITTSERNANMQALTERYRGTVARTNDLNSAALDSYYAKVAQSNATTSLIDTGTSAIGSLFKGYSLYKAGSI